MTCQFLTTCNNVYSHPSVSLSTLRNCLKPLLGLNVFSIHVYHFVQCWLNAMHIQQIPPIFLLLVNHLMTSIKYTSTTTIQSKFSASSSFFNYRVWEVMSFCWLVKGFTSYHFSADIKGIPFCMTPKYSNYICLLNSLWRLRRNSFVNQSCYGEMICLRAWNSCHSQGAIYLFCNY